MWVPEEVVRQIYAHVRFRDWVSCTRSSQPAGRFLFVLHGVLASSDTFFSHSWFDGVMEFNINLSCFNLIRRATHGSTRELSHALGSS